ncbi:MAG TPA: ABC transporter ATP-binding protein [Solirubrobacterales bacterium]|nr:ABC transporter ATP-binding protein [Solirubrobacterales bacterium]
MSLLLGGRKGLVAGLIAASLLSGLTEAGILAIMAQTATSLANGSSRIDVSVGPLDESVTIGALLACGAVLALLRFVLQTVLAAIPARIGTDMQARLRRELFDAFTRASWAVQSRDREGHLQELMTDQMAIAAAATLWTTMLLTAVFTFLMLLVSALALDPVVALIVLAVSAGLFAVLRPLGALGRRFGRAVSQSSMEHASGIGEAIRLTEETAVFGVAAAQRERINRLIAEIRHPAFRTMFLARLVPGVYQSMIYIFVVAGLAVLYFGGAGQVGSLGAVVLVLVRASSYGQQAQGAHQSLHQTLPYLERVQEAQQRYIASIEPAGTRPLESVSALAFEDVEFAYKEESPVLRGISFEVERGEAIGIVGPSGAGKSTLVQILLRLRSPDRGRYLIGGEPAASFAAADWHRLVAYVPQEPRLLHATVADNIRFFRDLDDEAIERAARLAGIHDEVTKWSQGYKTVVGPRADAVSGGQQQRICLARALAAQPEVLVLDEPTSSLDPHSEQLIQQSLLALQHKLTLFVVAHRMSTLDVCERVMVVVDGQLEGFDSASALRSNSAYYRSATEVAAGAALPQGG